MLGACQMTDPAGKRGPGSASPPDRIDQLSGRAVRVRVIPTYSGSPPAERGAFIQRKDTIGTAR
jgi:hypothetical protein